MPQSTLKRKERGRPRLLSREEILICALDVGLEDLTIRNLSERLGVGTGTIYQYFKTRADLMRAAAVYALGALPFPEDTGQDWFDLVRDYVRTVQDSLVDNPTFILNYDISDFGFEVQFRIAERFLTAMMARGFTPPDAMQIFNSIGIVAYGGAIETLRVRDIAARSENLREATRREFEHLDPAQFPLLAKALPEFSLNPEEKVTAHLKAVCLAFSPTCAPIPQESFSK